jgi:hypothetical protein
MASNTVLIIGGASFDFEIKDLFQKYDLYVEHYDARKSQSLRKQNIPKNTIGVIITVDRSHMTFGDSNELTRVLQTNNIPFVFSSGNLATYNSAKTLIQKMHKVYPEYIKYKEYIPENDKKLDFYKQEWIKNEDLFSKKLNNLFEIENIWQNKFNDWCSVLENWKIYLIEWNELQTLSEYKETKKIINKKFAYLTQWKHDIHNYGIKIERNISFMKQWYENIESSTLEVMELHDDLKLKIRSIENINEKQYKNDFKNWKVGFEEFKENTYLWEKQYQEWFNIFPQAFVNIEEWKKASDTWYNAFKKKLSEL